MKERLKDTNNTQKVAAPVVGINWMEEDVQGRSKSTTLAGTPKISLGVLEMGFILFEHITVLAFIYYHLLYCPSRVFERWLESDQN